MPDRHQMTERRQATIRFGQHLRTLRTQAQLTQATCATTANITTNTWRSGELGSTRPSLTRLPAVAAALGLPIAALFEHESPCVAEIRVSRESLDRVRKQGREAAQELADRLASQLEPLIWQEATRPPVVLSPDGRARGRRPRAAKLTADTKRKLDRYR